MHAAVWHTVTSIARLHSGQLHQGTTPGCRLQAAPPGVAMGGAAVRHRE